MKGFGKILLLGMGFGLMAAIVSWLPDHGAVSAAPGPTPVTVTNQPLAVSVNNFPSTQAVSGIVNINKFLSPIPIAGLVQVTDIDNPARNSIQGSCSVPPGAMNCTFTYVTNTGASISSVPSGFELVIEHVSGDMSLPLGTIISQAGLFTAFAGSEGETEVVPVKQGSVPPTEISFGTDYYTFSQPVRAYVLTPTGVLTTPTGFGYSTASSPAGFTPVVNVHVSGYLVQCGTGPGCPAQ